MVIRQSIKHKTVQDKTHYPFYHIIPLYQERKKIGKTKKKNKKNTK